MRRSRRETRIVSACVVLCMSAACRAIIGYSPIILSDAGEGESDAASPPDVFVAHDASVRSDARDAKASADRFMGVDASCPSLTPTVLFTTSLPIGALFLNGSYVYAELANTFTLSDAAFAGPFEGLVGCPKKGCSGTPEATVRPTIDGGLFGGATANDAGLFYARQQFAGDAAPGALESAGLDGGNVQNILARSGYPLLMVADNQILYWADDPASSTEGMSPDPWDIKAGRIGTDPIVPVLFTLGFADQVPVYDLFLDSKNVYALAGDAMGNNGLFVCPRLTSTDAGGGCPTGADEIVANVPTSTEGVPTDSFAADGVSIYQAGSESGDITRIDLVTHAPTVLASGQAAPTLILVLGSQLYWTTETGLIFHQPKDGSLPPVPLVCGLSVVTALVADESRVDIAASVGDRYEVASVPLPP